MSTDFSGSRAISAMQSPSRMVSIGNSFVVAKRGRERPRVPIAGRVMIMSGSPRLLDTLDEAGWTHGQDWVGHAVFLVQENKRNPLKSRPQHIESRQIRRTLSLVV